MPAPASRPTIGVFDSGFGGLTVLRALLKQIPNAHYIYLGDTARLPYGAKSQQTIARYAVESARFLLDQGIEMLVVACNTASALALEDLRQALPIPVVGVIEPGTSRVPHPQTTVSSSDRVGYRAHGSTAPANPGTSSTVLVLATTATVQSHAYLKSCQSLGLQAHEKACPLLVPLVEEGWIDHPVTAEVLRIYLTEALTEAPNVTTLLLGCTHYPLLKPMIERTLAGLDHPLQIIDSAEATAETAAQILGAPHLDSEMWASTTPTTTFYATDSTEKFARLGSHFLNQPIPQVHLLDLGG